MCQIFTCFSHINDHQCLHSGENTYTCAECSKVIDVPQPLLNIFVKHMYGCTHRPEVSTGSSTTGVPGGLLHSSHAGKSLLMQRIQHSLIIFQPLLNIKIHVGEKPCKGGGGSRVLKSHPSITES